MPVSDSIGDTDRRNRWQIVPEGGADAMPVELLPNDELQAQPEGSDVLWTATGEHACFRLSELPAHLPAGWYELNGQLECTDGAITLPNLRPGYRDNISQNARVPLPVPTADGAIRGLLLFLHPVIELRFYPGISQAKFRMHGFSLRRVSRITALKLMLGVAPLGGSTGRIRRYARFAVRAWRIGLSRAATALFNEYLRQLRAQGIADYEVRARASAALASSDSHQGMDADALASGDSLAPFLIDVDAPADMASVANLARRLEHEYRVLAKSGLFDAAYYLRNNRDVAKSGLDPLLHFCQYGWRGLRNPSPEFDVWWYWSSHLDPARERINPLVHYALIGRHDELEARPAPYRPAVSGHVYDEGLRIRRVCLFAGYDAYGLIDDYVVDYLRELSAHADVYYLADGEMRPGELEKIAGYVKGAWAFHHSAYDFGSYSLLARDLVGWQVIEQYDELIFANDSCYLLRSLDDVFAKMDAKACDWWGMQATKGIAATRRKKSNQFRNSIPMATVKDRLLSVYDAEYTYDFHIGSYFLVFRQPVIHDLKFRKLVDSVARQSSKLNIIRKYEIGIGRQLIANNHPFETFIEDLHPFHPIYSERIFELVRQGFPFFKRYFLAKNHYRVAGLLDWKERLLRLVPDAKVEQMEKNLFRVTDYEKLYRNLRIERNRFDRVVPSALLDNDAFVKADAACPKFDDWWAFPACAFNHTFSGNERAVFEAVRDDPSIKKIVLTRRKHIDIDGENVVVVPLRSTEGQYYLMRAKQIFIKHSPTRNLVYPVSPVLHNLINLWHGIPLKRIGYASLDMQNQLAALAAEHGKCRAVISSSSVDTMAMASAFYPLSYNDIWCTGLPRNDFILRPFAELPVDMRKESDSLGELLARRRLILFVPTFKGGQGDAYYQFSTDEVEALRAWLWENNAVLGVREHMADVARTYYSQLKGAGVVDLSDRYFADIEILYRHAAALVTDYSSCFIDFMLTKQPMISFAYDYDNYANTERGLFYDMEHVFPGPVSRNFAQLLHALEHVFDSPDAVSRASYEWKRTLFFDYLDDGSARRVVKKVKQLYEKDTMDMPTSP